MLNLRSLLLLTVFTAVAPYCAFAKGPGGTGGGNAVVCFADPAIPNQLRAMKKQGSGWIPDRFVTPSLVTSVELLDYHEAKTATGELGNEIIPEIIEAEQNETPAQYIERIKKRISNVYPGIPTLIENGKKILQTVKKFEHGLGPIDDVGPGENIDTEHCVRVTIIGQYDRNAQAFMAYDPRFYALPLSIFSSTNRAVSYLHEYLYIKPRLFLRQETSDNVRGVVGKLIQKNINVKKLYYGLASIDDRVTELNFLSKMEQILKAEIKGQQYLREEMNGFFMDTRCQNRAQELASQVEKSYKENVETKILAYPDVPSRVLENVNTHLKSQIRPVGRFEQGICNIGFGLKSESIWPYWTNVSEWFDFELP